MTPPPAAQAKQGLPGHRLFLFALAAVTLLTLLQFVQCAHRNECPVGGDFTVFYRAAQMAAVGKTDDIYDTAEARAWFNAPHGATVKVRPFVNPPFSLLALAPLGFFGAQAAFLLWYGAQALLLIFALCTPYARRWLAEGTGGVAMLLPVLPFAMYSVMSGQSGILCAALFLLVLAWRQDRPALAGAALACLCIKPQLAILFPLLLLKERNGRVLAYTALAGAVLVVAATALWGWGLWRHYFEMLGFFGTLIRVDADALVTASASPYLGFRMLGANDLVAMLMQGILSVLVSVALWRALGEAKEARIILLLTTATFLFSPYSFIYDTVLLAFAVLALLARWAADEARATDRIALILLAFIPIVALKIQYFNIPYTFAAVLFAFGAACRRRPSA